MNGMIEWFRDWLTGLAFNGWQPDFRETADTLLPGILTLLPHLSILLLVLVLLLLLLAIALGEALRESTR
nr:hypothetical protein [uncultured Gellertiella sp.]